MRKLRILLITTCFPPDNVVASVRPYMFAKYLTQLGYSVLVLASGEIRGKADSFLPLDGICDDIIYYLGITSPAEKYRRGEVNDCKQQKNKFSFLPKVIRKKIKMIYHRIFRNREVKKKDDETSYKFEKMKRAIDILKTKGENFDVVISTYGDTENLYGGEYAKKLFKAKYILDIRDMIAQEVFSSKSYYKERLALQKKAIENADVCTAVSESITKEVESIVPGKDCYTVYNGFDPLDDKTVKSEQKDIMDSGILNFCYTGLLYQGKSDLSPFFAVIKDLKSENQIDVGKIRLYYAGVNYDDLWCQANKYSLTSILVNKGFLARNDVVSLQLSSDIFIVLSWNTKTSKGILTGKLYEGIRSRKPIMTIVSGDEPDSELKELNEKYHYGICYEEANKKIDYLKLKDWVLNFYEEKIRKGFVASSMSESFYEDFKYENIVKKVDKIIKTLEADSNRND